MTRWTVAQHIYTKKWLAFQKNYDDLRPQNLLDTYPQICHIFHTHAEAMTYADKRARTIEVTLPRLAALPTDRHIMPKGYVMQHRGHTTRNVKTPTFIEVSPDEREPLALALLAHARSKK